LERVGMPLSARIASLQASQAKAGKLGVSLSTLFCFFLQYRNL